MNMIIFGATGRTGSSIVDLALMQGHSVNAFARDPKSFSSPRSGLSIVRGDVLDATAVEQSIAGHEIQVFLLGEATHLMRSALIDAIHPIGWAPFSETFAQSIKLGLRIHV